jgi:hypothetical protein
MQEFDSPTKRNICDRFCQLLEQSWRGGTDGHINMPADPLLPDCDDDRPLGNLVQC